MIKKLLNLFKKKPKECHFILEKNRLMCDTHNIMVSMADTMPISTDRSYDRIMMVAKATCKEVREKNHE